MKIVVFSGAGLSKESGIPTFRDCVDGLWEQFKIEEVATPEGWDADKKKVLDFYAARFKNVADCEPNAAHQAIAKLEQQHEVHNITQNIDDLLERAGCTNVWHMHGQINRRKCEWHNAIQYKAAGYRCDYTAAHTTPVTLADLCPKCDGHLRPDVVWFNEYVDMKDDYVQDLVDTADVFIGVGTSAQIYPAANFLYYFKGTPMKFFIDPNPSSRVQSYAIMQGSASEMMPQLTEELLKHG